MVDGGANMFVYDLSRLKEVPKIIRTIERNAGDVWKPLKRWEVHMIKETERTFRQGGRGPVRWRPLSRVTLIMRKFRSRGASHTNPLRILQDYGILKKIKSIKITQRGAKGIALFSRAPYAGRHQYGGTISHGPRQIRAKKAKFLHFMWKGQEFFRKVVNQPARTRTVPKREFLFITASDVRFGLDQLRAHAAEATAKTGRRR